MTPSSDSYAHLYLTFYEANILMQNFRNQDKSSFLARLQDLSYHTTDTLLLRELANLIVKITELSEPEFTALRSDVHTGTVLYPPNYRLPKIT